VNTITEETTWRNYLKHNRGLLVIGILFFLLGIWADIQWIPERPSGILYFLNLLPAGLLLLAWYLASKYQKRRWVIVIAGVLIALVISLFVVFMNVFTGAFVAATKPVTDVTRYKEIREQMGDSELTQHFPLSIPENAENVQFEYLPKFLQGGGHFQLRMELPQSEINELIAKFQPQAKYKFIGGDRSDHSNMEGGVPTTYFYTSGTDEHSFDDSYEILVLNAEAGGTPDFQWNHGYSYGVVISLEKSEIIYWAEYW
jgi:ABC-type transport system involved in multi-copper enzyme maturation permease subunit